eukprot:TRINITY_DN14041_c0_g1_i1.p1 TRINITY_DN14041_c0_g1~~TRINITY_DN14041_c0_g1_i1.p1  ORF type:complete len:196 (-),score=7.78 TRINITY_DN14041_c0_g1_i1:581-1168(-)
MPDEPGSPESNPEENEGGTSGHHEGGSSSVREQDRFLPIANISRIMKKALPQNAKIAKDAKETVQECVSEFISFITSEASDKCQREKRKTINGDDLLWAMSTLGFEDYVEPLKVYLHRYRETEGEGAGGKDGKPQGAQQQPSQSASLPGSSSLPSSGSQLPASTPYAGTPGVASYMQPQMMPGGYQVCNVECHSL